jgi:hypothetical protein
LECEPVKYKDEYGMLELRCKSTISKITLDSFPPGKYTLNINGINVMTSKGLVFDIENTHTQALDSLIDMSRKRVIEMNEPCICGECNVCTAASVGRCLHMIVFESVKICYSSILKDSLPEEMNITYLDVASNVLHETIYKSRYPLYLHSPTEQLVINVVAKSDKARVILFIGDYKCLDTYLPYDDSTRSQMLAIRFGCSMEGIEDFPLEGRGLQTCNFSRITGNNLALQDCQLESIYSSYYMTYNVPCKDAPTLTPMYKH